MKAVDLAALEAPIEPVTFPNGRTFTVVEFDAGAWELWQTVKAGHGEHTLALLRRCIPDATDEDLDTLTPKMIAYIFGAAQHKAELVLAVIHAETAKREAEHVAGASAGNAGAGAGATTSPRSSRRSSPRTSSPASPPASRARSTSSGRSRSTARSSPS